jgi:hypothetical protein
MSAANDRTLRIVVGYLARVDWLPLDLRDAGFVHRTAVAIDTWRADKADMWFDAEIYLALLDVAARVVGATRIVGVRSTGETVDLTEPACRRDRLALERDGNGEPFARVIFERESAFVAVVDAIPWVRVGGPAPYHDTWTIAMHTGDDVARVLAAEAMGACADAGALVEDVVRGSQRPDRPDPRIAIRERLRRLWRRIALGISPRDLTVPLHVPSPRRGSRR